MFTAHCTQSLHISPILREFVGVNTQRMEAGGWRGWEAEPTRGGLLLLFLCLGGIFLFVCLFCVWLEIGVLTIVIVGGWMVTAALSEIFTQPSPPSPLSPLSLLSPLPAVCCFQCNNISLISWLIGSRRYYAEPVVNGIPYSVKGYRGSARLYSVQVLFSWLPNLILKT